MLRTRVVMERGGGQWGEGAGAHFWLGTCHAFSSSRGLSGRGPGRGGPHRPHHAPPPDQKACTLGRRPDIFNGDAARILGQQPRTAQQQLPDQPARAPAARSPAAVLPATPPPAATHGLASASGAASTLALTQNSADPASAAALWCDQLRRLHRTATATQRRLDGLLRDLDTLELGTGPELRAAERLGKVLATYLSFAFPGAVESPEEPGTSLARPGMSSSSSTTGSSNSSSNGSSSSRGSSSKGWAFHSAHRASGREQQQPVAPESSVGHLRSLLARVEAAAAQLADIGRRHEAGAYAPLRRFYFSPDEPLQAISLRSEQYRRQLEGAAVACGPDSPEVANLVEEVAAALSSHTVAAFLELELEGLGEVQGQARGEAAAADTVAGTDASSGGDAGDAAEDSGGGSLERLAVAAAADYYSLQELRQELEVVGRSAEAAGVPVGQLLRLADLER